MTIYSDPLFTRAQINAAVPVVSTLGAYPFAHCLASRVSSWIGREVFIADYSELFAWQCEKSYSGNSRRIK